MGRRRRQLALILVAGVELAACGHPRVADAVKARTRRALLSAPLPAGLTVTSPRDFVLAKEEGFDHQVSAHERGRATGYREAANVAFGDNDPFTLSTDLKMALTRDGWSVDEFVIPPGGELSPGTSLDAVRRDQAFHAAFEAPYKQLSISVTTCLRGVRRSATDQGQPRRLDPPYDQQPVVTLTCAP